jgi:AraC-like DNA-binding protein
MLVHYSTDPLAARLQAALPSSVRAIRWAEVLSRAASASVTMVVVDPLAELPLGTESIVELRRRFPSIEVVLYSAMCPELVRAVLALAPHGVHEVVLAGVDDGPARWRELASGAAVGPLVRRLLAELDPELARLPTAVAVAVRRAFEEPMRFRVVEDLALAAGMSVRSVYRRFGAAGLASPRDLLVVARLVWAYGMLHESDRTVEEVARALGYYRGEQLSAHFRALGQVAVRDARQLRPDQLMRATTAVIRGSRACSVGSTRILAGFA